MCPECGNFDIAENPDGTGPAWWCPDCGARFNGPAEEESDPPADQTLVLCSLCPTGVHLATEGHVIVQPERRIFCDACWAAYSAQTAADRRGE